MSKQRVLVEIGYDQFLLPDDVGVAAAIKALSRAIRVRDYRHSDGSLRLVSDGTVKVGMSYVPANVRLKGEEGEELPSSPAPLKRLKQPTLRLKG